MYIWKAYESQNSVDAKFTLSLRYCKIENV